MSINKLIEAYNFASIKHVKQTRGGIQKIPYVNHVIGTVYFANQANIQDLDILIGCILHDIIEDTDTNISEILEIFGKTVADYVLEVTDSKEMSRKERKQNQVYKALNMSDGAKCIKMADKLYNITDEPKVGWTKKYILGSNIWIKKVTDNLLLNVIDINILNSLNILKKQVDIIGIEVFKKYDLSEKDYYDEEFCNNLLSQYYESL